MWTAKGASLRGLGLTAGQPRLEGRTGLLPPALGQRGETVGEWFLRATKPLSRPPGVVTGSVYGMPPAHSGQRSAGHARLGTVLAA